MKTRVIKGREARILTLSIVLALLIAAILFFNEVRMQRQLYTDDIMFRHLAAMHDESIQVHDDQGNPKKDNAVDSLLIELNTLGADENGFPSRPGVVAIYSEQGKLIRRSCSMLMMATEDGDRYVDMEPYLTPELKRQYLETTYGDYSGELRIKSVTYIEKEDGSIIPIEIVHYTFMYKGEYVSDEEDLPEDYEEVDLILDFREQNGLTEEDYKKYEVKKCTIANAFFVNDFDNVYRELYSFIREEIEPSTVYPPVGPKGGVATVEGASITSSGRYKMYDYLVTISPLVNLKVNGNVERCYVYYLTMDNMYKKAWHNSDFQRKLDIISVPTIIFVAAYLSYLYNKKKRQIETAKETFIGAAAHELKTPISVIQNQSEFILEGVAPEKTKEYVESIYEESLRMDKLVKSIQQYDRLGDEDEIRFAKFDLANVVRAELERYKKIISAGGISLETDIPTSVPVMGDENLISLVVDNFLSNAAKYTSPSGKIKVKLSNVTGGKSGRALFSVENSSDAFTDEELKSVWDIFYKKDKARARDNSADATGGMGLALCKRILELHGFKYGCRNVEGGVEFWFETSH